MTTANATRLRGMVHRWAIIPPTRLSKSYQMRGAHDMAGNLRELCYDGFGFILLPPKPIRWALVFMIIKLYVVAAISTVHPISVQRGVRNYAYARAWSYGFRPVRTAPRLTVKPAATG